MAGPSEPWPPSDYEAADISKRLDDYGITFAVSIGTRQIMIKPSTDENVELVREAIAPLDLEIEEWVGPLPRRY